MFQRLKKDFAGGQTRIDHLMKRKKMIVRSLVELSNKPVIRIR